MVKLVCVLVKALIKNKAVDVDQLIIPLQSFCMEFSSIKQAADLLSLLKCTREKISPEEKNLK